MKIIISRYILRNGISVYCFIAKMLVNKYNLRTDEKCVFAFSMGTDFCRKNKIEETKSMRVRFPESKIFIFSQKSVNFVSLYPNSLLGVLIYCKCIKSSIRVWLGLFEKFFIIKSSLQLGSNVNFSYCFFIVFDFQIFTLKINFIMHF